MRPNYYHSEEASDYNESGEDKKTDPVWEQILPCKYDEITAIIKNPNSYDPYEEKYLIGFVVKQNGKWGVISSNGKEILPCQYAQNEISFNKISSETYRLRAKDKFGIINSQGEVLLPCKYEEIAIESSGYEPILKVRQNGKWGAINTKGAIPCKYTEIVPVRNFYAVKDGKKWGIVGAAGNTILAPTYKLDKVEAFGNFFKVSYKKHFGLLDGTGKLVLPIAYEEITKRDGSSFFVKQKGKWGVADSKGKITVPCSHESTAGISR